jgi:hypothetical protein
MYDLTYQKIVMSETWDTTFEILCFVVFGRISSVIIWISLGHPWRNGTAQVTRRLLKSWQWLSALFLFICLVFLLLLEMLVTWTWLDSSSMVVACWLLRLGKCWLLCRILPLNSSESRQDTEKSGKNATPGLDKTTRRERNLVFPSPWTWTRAYYRMFHNSETWELKSGFYTRKIYPSYTRESE